MTKEFEFLKNAKVEVEQTNDRKGNKVAKIVVDDKYEHQFGKNSRISKALDIMTPELLTERMTDGHYFFVDGNLYDFREGMYKGFVQSDETILQLIDLLGMGEYNDRNDMRVHENVTSKKVKLGRKWSINPITIPSFKDGGEFKSELHYGWSPFMKTINSAFRLERLICTNGMRGMRTFLNTKIPLVNRWSEHLDMASIQLQNKVDAIVTRRFGQMVNERASVAELNALANHAGERIGDKNRDKAGMLRNLRDIADPKRHLNGIYQANLFAKGSPAAAQYPGHLTTLDAYNIATEIRSHTEPTTTSTTRALDLIANDIVFDRKDIILPSSGKVGRKVSAFSDPDAAFFGVMN
jgi:hypothetical protein